jgi:hypothetical protein
MMISSLVALVAAWVGAGPASTPHDLRPRLQVGQELVYDGTIQETRGSDGGQAESTRRLTVRALVLQKSAKGVADVGVLTVHKEKELVAVSRPTELDDAIAIRMDKVQVDPTGHARWLPSGAEIAPPVDADMISEMGFFIEMPTDPKKVGEKWVFEREGQPSIRAEVLGVETVIGARCVVVGMDQESPNWANEEINLLAWKITTKLLFDPKTQSVCRIEREVATRSPSAPLDRHVRKVMLEQGTNVRFHGNVLQNQIEDFETAYQAQQDLDAALALDDANRARKLHSMQHDLKFAMQRLYSTPYRPIIEKMHERAVDAEKWETAQEKRPVPVLGGPKEVRVGQRAPHFLLHDVASGQSISLKTVRGESVVMVFVDPTSDLSLDALRTTLAAVAKEKRAVKVFAVGTRIDPEMAAELHQKVAGDYVVCKGGATDSSYGVKGVPHVVCVDSQGILRVNQKGFGPEVFATLVQNLSALPATNIAQQKPEKEIKRSFRR